MLASFFPNAPKLAMTATAPPAYQTVITNSVCLWSPLIIRLSPDRPNIYLEMHDRMPSWHSIDGYNAILEPLAKQLTEQRQAFPLTIVYLPLKYCGYAYRLFEREMGDEQFLKEPRCPEMCLFAQFHIPQTEDMKRAILKDLLSPVPICWIIFGT